MNVHKRIFFVSTGLFVHASVALAGTSTNVNFTLPADQAIYSHGVELISLMQTTPDFSYDFEQGINAVMLRGAEVSFNPDAPAWRFAQIQNSKGMQILQEPSTGNHYAMTYWEKDGGLMYDENTQRKIQFYGEFGAHARQEEVWYFETYFANDGFGYDSYPEIIVQLHGKPDECEYDRPPPLAIEVKQDNIIVSWRNDDRKCTPAGFSDWNTRVRNLGPLPKDQRVIWTVHVAWDPGGYGALTIIVNNNVLLQEENIYIGYEDDVGPYLGWGIYKFIPDTNYPSRTIYYDNFKQWILK